MARDGRIAYAAGAGRGPGDRDPMRGGPVRHARPDLDARVFRTMKTRSRLALLPAVRLVAACATAACLVGVAGCAAPASSASSPAAAPGPSPAPYGPPRGRPVTPLPPRAPAALPAEPQALADAMRGHPAVLLGEVHDNAAQHALRAEALGRLVAGGTRPAIAFEQFDRERQGDIDRARRERPRDAAHLIAQAGGDGWDWRLYEPLVKLALEHDLPIVAANLSRRDASRVVREGLGAVFDAPARAALGLDAIDPALLAAHEREVDEGHCGLMPAAMLAPMARAQIARDAALAGAIAPHADRGVVLLAGNGHVRRDLGVAVWLPEALRSRTLSIGLLEPAAFEAARAGTFDRVVRTAGQAREDPCASLKGRAAPGAQGR
jgi:uncharacterized iron-regulated protein